MPSRLSLRSGGPHAVSCGPRRGATLTQHASLEVRRVPTRSKARAVQYLGRPAGTRQSAGGGWPRREAALRWLSWRWRGVSRPEGEVAAACGRLPLHVATRRPGRRWARCSCASRRCTMWRRPCGPGCLGRVGRRRTRSCVRGGDLCHTGLTMERERAGTVRGSHRRPRCRRPGPAAGAVPAQAR